jgi:predicted NAD/FAD-binding protein
MACHSDQAAAVLPAASQLHRIAAQVRYQDNTAVLHTDTRLMPKRRKAWAAWNYIHDARSQDACVSVTYWMNRLQPLPVSTPVLVSLNPLEQPDPATVINTMHYAHPIFDGPAVQAQQALGQLQGEHRIWLAGAWTRYGFHEDGFQSGVNAARSVQSALASTGHASSYPKAA